MRFEPVTTADRSPKLLSRVAGATMVFAPSRVNLSLPHDSEHAVQIVFPGSQLSSPAGTHLLPSQTNYLLGNDPTLWVTHVPNYGQVTYPALYPGVDLRFYGNGRQMEHDFVVAPGAEYRQIRMHFDGAKARVQKDGSVSLTLAGGVITLERPVIYQQQKGVRIQRSGSFRLLPNGDLTFAVPHYDHAQPLIIDPVLDFATYLSPDGLDASSIAVDAAGNNYVTGYGSLGYPVTPNAFNGCSSCSANGAVIFISKLSADGTNLIYSTVVGGNSFAQPTGIAVDANGDAVVSGWTGATNFPTKNAQPILPPDNNYLGVLLSLSPDGSALNFSTLLSQAPTAALQSMTYAMAVALDPSGNVYVTGDTGNGFPVSAGALNQGGGANGAEDTNVYLSKFDPSGNLLYSAVIGISGGPASDGASALAVDAEGNAYVAGQAGIAWPTTSNAYLKQVTGTTPYAGPFVTKVAPDAKSLIYSTYLDPAYIVTGISALANGDVMVSGSGVGPNHPTTANAYQAGSAAGGEAFVTELDATGSNLVYATTVGDSTYSINGMTLDADGNIWVAGETRNAQFPLVLPVQGTFPVPGVTEPASTLSELDPTLHTLKMSTFLGGSAIGYASDVAVDGAGKVHVSGAAVYGMYTTPGVYAGSVPNPGPAYQDVVYGYVALVDPITAGPTLCFAGAANAELSFGYLALQTTATQTVSVTNCGNAPLTFSSVTSNNAVFTVPAANNGCMGSLPVNASCTVTVAFTPTAVQAYAGQLTFTSSASVATTAMPLAGNGGVPSAGFGPAGIRQTLTFSDLLVGQTSQPEIIGLYNNGTVPLTVYLPQIAVSSGFTLAPGGNCTASLAPQQSCAIAIEFTPVSAGTIQGTLSVSTNDPVNPTITTSLTGTAFSTYPIATITGLLNPSYPINSPVAPITMTVLGTNFFAGSVVSINGAAQTTTYQSDSRLTVTFSSSLLNTVGEIPVTVVNPAPGGGTSASYSLLGYLAIPLTASALTIDPVGGLLYAAIPSTASQNPNTIIPINPTTGAQQAPIAVATNPQRLAVSADGSELYVASTGVLQRINLKTMAIERTFNLPVDSTFGQTYIQEMHVVPGSPQSIVVELFVGSDPAEDGAALYNDSGLVNWIPGDSLVNGANTLFWLDSFTFTSSPSVLYGLPAQTTIGFFAEVNVAPTGISRGSSGNPGDVSPVTGSIVRSDGTLLYTDSGQVWDPSSQKLLGTYLAPDGSQFPYTAAVLPYSADQHTYFLDTDTQYSSYQALAIDVYDQAGYALLGTVPFTNIYPPDVSDLVRWGSNGFAFRSVDTTGSQPAANQIVILTSSLVANNNAAPVPILSAVSPAKVSAGGPAYTMQLTGSGFTSASTVLVNGSSRPTTFVSSSSLTCQVQASDIVSNGQLNVQVTTPAPGGGTSASATVLILSQKETPALSVTPSAASITSAQALTVVVAVNGGAGAATPTGATTLTSGSYTSAPAVLSGGTASIVIPAGTLPVGNDTLTVTYSGDANYSQATGNASVAVTIPPGFTLSASPATLSVAQGGQATSTITVTTTGGFSGAVTLSTTGLPTGVTATFVAGSAAGTQLLTLAAAASAATTSGSVTVGITGASGAVTASTTLALSITSEPSFTAGSGSTTAITLTPGAGTGNTATINVVGTHGFSGTVNLTCSVTTSLASVNDKPACSLSPDSVSISGSTAQATTLTVSTTPASTAYLWPSAGGTVLAFVVLFIRPRKRSPWNTSVALCILLASAGIVACGGGNSGGSDSGGNSGTTPGTYTVTVTGTSGSANAVVASVTVTVQ